MKTKKKAFLAFALALVVALVCMTATAFAAEAKQLTVNNGTNNKSGFPYGMDTNNVKFKSQFIQPSSTLADMKGSTITKMTFYVQNTPGDNDAVFEVRLKEVTESSFTSDALINVTDATLVYTGKANPDANNQVVISFTTPYEYKGGNLLVDFRITTAGASKVTVFYGATQSYFCSINGANGYYQDQFLPKVTFDYEVPTYLDLEASANYAEKKDIEQNYTFKQANEEYTDVTKVKLDWTVTDIAATYKSHKTWDPDNMEWVEAKEGITAADQTATFKLTNYSSASVYVKASFAAEDSLKDTLSSATFANNKCTVATPVKQDTTTTYQDSDFTALAQTITATLSFSTDAFAKLNTQTAAAKYGTYTIAISEKAPAKMTVKEVVYNGVSADYGVASTLVYEGTTWTEIVANNADNKVTLSLYQVPDITCTLKISGTNVILEGSDGTDSYTFKLITENNTEAVDQGTCIQSTDAVTDTLWLYKVSAN